MIRQLMLNKLTEALGPPHRSTSQDWWIVQSDGRPTINVCLNQKVGDHNVGHVLVFDPSAAEGHTIVELRVATAAEITPAVERIQRIVGETPDS